MSLVNIVWPWGCWDGLFSILQGHEAGGMVSFRYCEAGTRLAGGIAQGWQDGLWSMWGGHEADGMVGKPPAGGRRSSSASDEISTLSEGKKERIPRFQNSLLKKTQ